MEIFAFNEQDARYLSFCWISISIRRETIYLADSQKDAVESDRRWEMTRGGKELQLKINNNNNKK